MVAVYPSADEILAALGDKVVFAFVDAHERTSVDWTEYRGQHPAWAAEASERGIAAWLHDRFFAHLKRSLDDVAEVFFVESGATRDLYVGMNLRVRVKRHSSLGRVATYPTHTATLFMAQAAPTLELLEIVNLCAGYMWDPDLRDLAGPVLSLRDGLDNLIWMRDLPSAGSGSQSTPIVPAVDGPTGPVIDVARVDDEDLGHP